MLLLHLPDPLPWYVVGGSFTRESAPLLSDLPSLE